MQFQINYQKDKKVESFIVEGESISACKDKTLDELFKREVNPKSIWSNQLNVQAATYSEDEKKITNYDVEIEK